MLNIYLKRQNKRFEDCFCALDHELKLSVDSAKTSRSFCKKKGLFDACAFLFCVFFSLLLPHIMRVSFHARLRLHRKEKKEIYENIFEDVTQQSY